MSLAVDQAMLTRRIIQASSLASLLLSIGCVGDIFEPSEDESAAGGYEAKWSCGNGVCKGKEDCNSCPIDCGSCGGSGMSGTTSSGGTSGSGGTAGTSGAAGSSGTGATTATPHAGTPAPIPGTFEAEDFDDGGEGVGYHDNVAGNAGGVYRTSEDVDIRAITDSVGNGYTVYNFETGEWLSYTVQVAATGLYDLELRTATSFTDSAFRIEVDGKDVTGTIAVPSTGGWSSFQWIGKKGVSLAAGTHLLRVVAVKQYFDLSSIRVLAATTSEPSPTGAKKLFASGFEGTITLSPLVMYGTGAWQDIAGTDSQTGFSWPPKIWNGTGRFQQITEDEVTSSTLPSYMYDEIQTVTGRSGNSTRALCMALLKGAGSVPNMNNGSNQNVFHVLPSPEGQGDLYLSYWLKLQSDLVERMTITNWSTRVVTDWKTKGDYRVILSIFGDGANKTLYWNLRGDNVANGGLPEEIYWNQTNETVPVPVGKWFHVEVFVHRSGGSDGRVWISIDGQMLFDRYGSNMGIYDLPWNRVMSFINYSQSQLLPAYQWVDDFEIWDGFPASASSH